MTLETYDSTQYPWYIRIFFYFQRKKYGKILTPNLYWGRIPKLFFAMAFFYNAINRKNSELPLALRSLIMVRISQINDCPFCINLNSSIFQDRSTNLEQLQALSEWRTSKLFNEKERVTLEYAEAVTDPHIGVKEELRTKLSEHFNKTTIIELTALIAYQNLSSKFNHGLNIPPQGFCLKKE